MFKVVKRNGEIADFDKSKIVNALHKANLEVAPSEQISDKQIETIIENLLAQKKEKYPV